MDGNIGRYPRGPQRASGLFGNEFAGFAFRSSDLSSLAGRLPLLVFYDAWVRTAPAARRKRGKRLR